MILTAMTRRTVFQLAGAAAALPPFSAQPAPLKGRLKQSAARWCYSKISLDDLAREGARIGLQGIDLIDYKEWPTVQKYGLVPAMTPGAGTIGDGFNRKENHDRLVREMEENIARAATAEIYTLSLQCRPAPAPPAMALTARKTMIDWCARWRKTSRGPRPPRCPT